MYVDSDKDLLCMRILAHAMWEEDCWAPGKLHLTPPKPVVTSFITPERTGGKRGTTVLLGVISKTKYTAASQKYEPWLGLGES